MSRLADDFTLIIPTYNRPERLRKLLSFLSREKLSSRIIVCDSSVPSHMAENRTIVSASAASLDVRLVEYDPSTPVWHKFAAGAELVTTPFAALCADDDFVLPSAVAGIVERMKDDPAVALGHGWYFSFDEGDKFELRDVVYRGRSISDADPVRRMYDLCSRYEPLTYGIHRTEVMTRAFSRVRAMDTMLTKEVGSSVLVAIAGKVERYELLYHGRSAAPSQPYIGWHPLEMLADLPEELFKTYGRYREVIAESLAELTREYSQPDLLGLVDLCHLRYLGDVVNPRVLDHLVRSRIDATAKTVVLSELWDLYPQTSPSSRVASSLLRLLKAITLPPKIVGRRARHAEATRMETRSITACGTPRSYILQPSFLDGFKQLSGQSDDVAPLLRKLDNYDA